MGLAVKFVDALTSRFIWFLAILY